MKKAAQRARAMAAAALIVAVAAVAPACGQEQQLVEEVVARVNADVITRSQYLEIVRDTEADFKANLKPEEAEKRLAEVRPQILDLMIDNLLLVQKGQELGIDVEAQINQQFRRLAEEQKMSITDFEEAMRKSGLDPNEARARLRERIPVEHSLAHLGRRQGRRARYCGTRRNLYDLRRAAAVQNVAAWVKYAAMAAFVIFGFTIGKGSWSHFSHLATAAPAMASTP